MEWLVVAKPNSFYLTCWATFSEVGLVVGCSQGHSHPSDYTDTHD